MLDRTRWALDQIEDILNKEGSYVVTGQALASAGMRLTVLRERFPSIKIERVQGIDAYKLSL